MNIDNEIIKEAKEVLGGKAADIIANGIHLEKWDSKTKKGCCPIHSEKTPSFVWDSKHNFFKCFGCGCTLDIIDYYTTYCNMSFLDSVKELFRETNTNFDFSIYDNQNRVNKKYRYPKEEEENKENDPLVNYMNLRCISKDTLNYAGVKLNKENWIVWEYKDTSDKLLTVKYRYCGKYDKHKPPKSKSGKVIPKTFCQKDKDTTPILWGMNQINTTKPLLICEGEMDRLACIESGFKNVVSIPFGAGNNHWIEECWEWLNQFEKIYVWFDEDEAGDKARKEVVPRLGEERCWVIRQKYNDINILLYKEGKESILKAIKESKQTPIPDTMYLLDAESFDINKAEKIETPYKELNKWIGGFVLGTLDVITGINSSGKSTLINHMCIAHALQNDYKVWIYSGELSPAQLKSWIEFPIAGPNNIKEFDNGPNKPKGYAVYKNAKNKIKQKYRKNIFMYNNENDMSAKNILKRMEQLAKVNGVKVFLLDNLMMIDLECNKFEELKKQKEFVLALKNFTRKYNTVVHLIAHPRKVEAIRRLSKLDVAGSGDITNLSDYVISVHRVTPKEKEDIENKNGTVVALGCQYDTILDLFKNRPMGYQDKAIGLNFDYASKRFYGPDDDCLKEYAWKDEKYIEVDKDFEEVENIKCPWD